jgi:very-short-patch-repair endonuclease
MAPSLKLIVEVDGKYHCQRVTADARRTRVLERLGYRVLRLDAELVSRQLPLAVEAVRSALQALSWRGAP